MDGTEKEVTEVLVVVVVVVAGTVSPAAAVGRTEMELRIEEEEEEVLLTGLYSMHREEGWDKLGCRGCGSAVY